MEGKGSDFRRRTLSIQNLPLMASALSRVVRLKVTVKVKVMDKKHLRCLFKRQVCVLEIVEDSDPGHVGDRL